VPQESELPVVEVETLFDGFEQAFERWRTVEFGTHDPIATFIPLFETLEWTACLDERLGQIWARPGEPRLLEWSKDLRGLRWARHRVHHDWAVAVRAVPSIELPGHYEGAPEYEWVWRDELPQERPVPQHLRKDEPHYQARLAGRPARVTINLVREFFRQMDARNPRAVVNRNPPYANSTGVRCHRAATGAVDAGDNAPAPGKTPVKRRWAVLGSNQ
jgi:hypothetical protein